MSTSRPLNGAGIEQSPSAEPEVLLTASAVENATQEERPQNNVRLKTKIVVKPNKELKSPFMSKRHLLFSRPDPTILDKLHQSVLSYADEEFRVSSNYYPSFSINLNHRYIKKSVQSKGLMDKCCLDLAVRNMAIEDAENFKNTKCLGWRHYVDSNYWMQPINNDPNNLRAAYSRESTLYDPSGSHLVFIPVLLDDHWTLYAFNMNDKKLSILDSLPDTSEGGCEDPVKHHEKIRKIVCGALNKTMDFAVNFLSWEYEFPKVPRHENSYDCGFFVFNFMRLWDGHRLIRWFSTETMELRKNFLAYILSSKYNDAVMPDTVSEWIQKLPGDTRMDLKLLEAARAGNANEFCQLIDPTFRAGSDEQQQIISSQRPTSDGHAVPRSGSGASTGSNHQHLRSSSCCHCALFQRTSPGSYCFCFDCTSPRRPAKPSSGIGTAAPTAGCPPIWQATVDGDGVLHIALNFKLVEPAVLSTIMNMNGSVAFLQAGNNRGDRPLHRAAAAGSKDAVETIVNKAKSVTKREPSVSVSIKRLLRGKNLHGHTCLHEAVRFGHIEIVKYLVSEDNRLEDPNGLEDPNQWRDIVPLPLVQIADNKGISPLFLATTIREDDIVKALIPETASSAISPSYSGPAGKTALHAAVLLSTELSSTLVNWNPSLIKIPDESGSTPLHYLAAGGKFINYIDGYSYTSISKLLLEKDPSSGYCVDSEGSLPIHIAAANEELRIIRQLIEMSPGCEISTNPSGKTILHIAIQKGSYGVVRHVCSDERFKMILNMKDNDGNTALHLAVRKGCSTTFGILMGCRDVGLSIRNNNGYTPLDLVVLNRRTCGLTYSLVDYGWIYNSLRAAEADFGNLRVDYFSGKIPQPTKANNKAFPKKVSTSATAMATCAALLFNAALNIFLNVESKISENKTATDHVSDQYYKLTQQTKKLCGVSLCISAFAILLSVIAGLPILPTVAFRASTLILGLVLLTGASMFTLKALAARFYLANVSGAGMATLLITFSIFFIALCFILMRRIWHHARPLWARCGSYGLFRAILRTRGCQNYSVTPLFHVAALIELSLLTVVTVGMGVDISRKDFS